MLSRAATSLDPNRIFAGIAFDGQKAVCAAVSGGGDSLALLTLLKNHFDEIPNPPALIAVTVDHGLRPEAADEARMVAQLCAARGIEHRTVVWQADKAHSGIAAAARAARLALLAQAARDTGAQIVLTGHTQDDQAETLSMRLARGTGRGAAGIPPATLYKSPDLGPDIGDVWFLRPLLHLRRPVLRNFLRQAGIAWIDDPSNENPDFERVRVRQALGEEDIAALSDRAEQAARERIALGRDAAAMIDKHARRMAPGLYRLQVGLFEESDVEAALYAFRILTAMAGGCEHLPGRARAETAFRAVRQGLCATLSRSVVDVRRAGVHLHRESRNLPELALLVEPRLWDGRFQIGLRDEAKELGIAAPALECVSLEGHELPQDLYFASQMAEPAVWRNGKCLGMAMDHAGISCIPAGAPWARLVPSFDLAPARAIARLCEASAIPPAPLTGHNQP